MARFTLTIDCDNAAFAADDLGPELQRILAVAGKQLALTTDRRSGRCYDANGNTVGSWQIEGEREPEFDFGWSELCEEDPDDEGRCAYHDAWCTEAGPATSPDPMLS